MPLFVFFLKFFFHSLLIITFTIHVFCHYRNLLLDDSSAGKFESIYDIEYNKYRSIIIHAANKITNLNDDKLANHVEDFVEKLKIKYGKSSKSIANVKNENGTPCRATQSLTKTESSSSGSKPVESSSTSQDEEEILNIPEDYLDKLATYLGKIMDLPVELYDQIISLLDMNDFATVAELAESEGCVEIAIFARSWVTMQ